MLPLFEQIRWNQRKQLGNPVFAFSCRWHWSCEDTAIVESNMERRNKKWKCNYHKWSKNTLQTIIITGLIGSRGNGKEEINYREKRAYIDQDWVAKPLEHVFPSAPEHS